MKDYKLVRGKYSISLAKRIGLREAVLLSTLIELHEFYILSDKCSTHNDKEYTELKLSTLHNRTGITEKEMQDEVLVALETRGFISKATAPLSKENIVLFVHINYDRINDYLREE